MITNIRKNGNYMDGCLPEKACCLLLMPMVEHLKKCWSYQLKKKKIPIFFVAISKHWLFAFLDVYFQSKFNPAILIANIAENIEWDNCQKNLENVSFLNLLTKNSSTLSIQNDFSNLFIRLECLHLINYVIILRNSKYLDLKYS